MFVRLDLCCYHVEYIKSVNLVAFPCIQTVVLLACLQTNKQTKMMLSILPYAVQTTIIKC